MRWNEIKIRRNEPPVSKETIREVEDILGVKFPDDYVECIQHIHGSRPTPNQFIVIKEGQKKFVSGVGIFLHYTHGKSGYIVQNIQWTSQSRPEWIIPFAEDGGGDYICFNYNIKNPDETPTIAYWGHDLPEDEAVIPLCSTFTEFIDMLDDSAKVT